MLPESLPDHVAIHGLGGRDGISASFKLSIDEHLLLTYIQDYYGPDLLKIRKKSLLRFWAHIGFGDHWNYLSLEALNHWNHLTFGCWDYCFII